MININPLIKYTNYQNVSFGAKLPQKFIHKNPDHEDNQYKSNRHFTLDDAFASHIDLIFKHYKPVSAQKEKELGQKINVGRHVEEVLSVYLPERNIELKTKFENFSKVKSFINKFAPEREDKILKAAQDDMEHDALIQIITNGEKARQFLNNDEFVDEPLIQEIASKYDYFSSLSILRDITRMLKDGYKSKKLINNVNSYRKEGMYNFNHVEQIKQGKIPVDFQEKLDESKKAQNELINAYLPYVLKMATKHKRNLEFLDANQEGSLALIDAAKNFDYSRGVSFIAYLSEYIKGYSQSASWKKVNLIKISEHVQKPLNQYQNDKRDLSNIIKREPTIAEIADHTGKTIEEVTRYENFLDLRKIQSISTPRGESDDSEIGEIMCNQDALLPDKEAINRVTRSDLKQSFKHLIPDKRARLILALRNGPKDLTLNAIGQSMAKPVTRERIRQIEAKTQLQILLKVKEYMEAKKLSPQEKRDLWGIVNTQLTQLEKKILTTKLGVYSDDGEELSVREIKEKLKIPKINYNEIYNTAVAKLKRVDVTEQDVKKLRRFTYERKLFEIYRATFGKDPVIPDNIEELIKKKTSL